MATNANDFCRLCGNKNEFTKDLLDECNKYILDLIRQYTKIIINDLDNMPTRVCLDCEEKMVSFELFILECYKVQDTLRQMCLEKCDGLTIKLESHEIDFGFPAVKSEVKHELSAEEFVNAMNNVANSDDFDAGNMSMGSDNEEEDDLDNVTIASLKEIKTKQVKKRDMSEQDAIEFEKLLKKTNLKIKDFVKLACTICEKQFKSWPLLRYHYCKIHRCKPVVYCICGYAIKSKSVLYQHVTNHKLESRRLKKSIETDHPKGSNKAYAGLNVKDFVSFTCPDCEKECSSWYSLKSHCERYHKIAPVVTCSCGITLKSKSVMYKHIQDHKNPNVLSCDQCSLITKSVAALNRHKMKHVPKSDRKFCCASCDKIFTSKDALKSHARSHIPIEDRKIYHCDICNLKFTTRSSAASHKRVVHEKIKSYVCDLCGYACGTNGELRQHRAIHSDDKPFVCRKCSKPFKTYSNLKTHMDTHEETSYACYVCNRVLNSRRTLRKHLLVHEEKCRHVCSYCNKAFKRRQTLKVHMYTHTGDKPLSCKWCDERFSYASTLRSHRLRCHPDKMAAHTHTSYTYTHNIHQPMQETDYIKSDLAAIGVAKNEVEAM